jgi:DNA mismatch repair protein MutL
VGVIQELPELVANKIAAGEVIERPASVVKELVENALDAGARRIEVQLRDGGRKLIRVTDNGGGMAPDDVVMCFHPHATSKLRTSDDLFFVTTMGFRGEALPSIGAVAKVRLVSREQGTQEGAAIEVEGGSIGEPKPAAAPEGTTVEVRNLFFNTPARKKFLRTAKTELGHVMEAVTRMALPHEQVHFIVVHNGKSVLNAPATSDRRARLAAFFGQELCRDLLPVEGGTGELRVDGFAAPPAHARRSTSTQYIFLNRRYVRDRTLGRAIREAYQDLLMPGRYPVLFLFLQMDPREVDVNVHPTKIEVRFRQGRRVFVMVRDSLKAALDAADLAPPVRPDDRVATSWSRVRHTTPPPRQQGPELWRGPAGGGTGPSGAPPGAAAPQAGAKSQPEAAFADPFAPAEPQAPFFQVHQGYLIEETQGGFRVTDQHALHERVLYEELAARSEQAEVESQKLLMPEVVELSAQEAALAAELLEPLQGLGIQAEEFGENTLAVHALPRILGEVDVPQLVHDLLGELAEEDGGPNTVEEQRRRLLRAVACQAAAKVTERLSHGEIAALLARRDALGPKAETCPHGRPVSLVFPLDDLERQFKRK